MNQVIMLDGGIQIPRLKKREEERRGAGAPLPWLQRTAGVGLASGQAPSGAFSSVLWGLNGRGGLAQLLNGALLRLLTPGELVFLVLGVLGLAAMLTLGISAWLNESRDMVPLAAGWIGESAPVLAEARPEEAIARPLPGELIADRSYLADAAAGSADEAPAAPTPAPTEAAPAGPEEAAPDAPELPVPATRAVLVSALERGMGRSFAGGAAFGSPRDLRDALAGAPAAKGAFLERPPLSKLGGREFAPRPKAVRRGSGRNAASATAARAMGQLKFAERRSFGALGASQEGARQYAADAFEQSVTGPQAGAIEGGGLSNDSATVPLGSGAPDMTAPSVGPGVNKTPYQDKVDDAKKGIDKAMLLTLLGLALLAAGAVALMVGKKMMAMPAPAPATGAALMKLGKVLLIAGAAALLAGMMASKHAKQDARDVAERSGQQEQGAVIDDCAGKAVLPQSCQPAPIEQPGNTVHEAVVAESGAGYSIQNGGPVGAGSAR